MHSDNYIWSYDILLELTRLWWPCIVLVQLWKVKQMNLNISWSILNTYTKVVKRNTMKSVHYTKWCILKHKMTPPYAQAFTKWCIFLISWFKSCGKLKLPTASGRSKETTPPRSWKTYSSSKDRPNLQAQTNEQLVNKMPLSSHQCPRFEPW